jgi:hypothetical protein
MNKALQFEPRKGGEIKMFNRKVTKTCYMFLAIFIILAGLLGFSGIQSEGEYPDNAGV